MKCFSILLQAALLATALSSCATLSGYNEPPKIDLKRVDVKNAGLTSATAIFVLNVKNPNKVAIHLDQIDYDIFLNKAFFSKASTNQNLDVPAQSNSHVELPLPIEYAKLGSGLKQILTGAPIDYRIKGHARVMSVLNLPFDESGNFSLHDLAK